MSNKIDTALFQEGRVAFNRGASLRDIVEHINKLMDARLPAELEALPEGEDHAAAMERAAKWDAWYEAKENAPHSLGLGYADAFVEMLRRVSGEKRGGGARA